MFKSFHNINIIADSSGSSEFQIGMAKYIEGKKATSILFDDSHYSLINSKNSRFVQIADFIAGTLLKIHTNTQDQTTLKEFNDILKDKVLFLDHWPPFKTAVVGAYADKHIDDKKFLHDEIVRRLGVESAISYINSNPGFGEKESEIRNEVVKFLLYQIRSDEKNSFIISRKIISHLKSTLGHSINVHYLTSKIISRLRDSGVLISSGDKGYKIPCSVSDILEYVRATDLKVVPMIKRINNVSKALHVASSGTLNIIEKAASEDLKKFITILLKSV